ncbi:MAG: hypothetical protein AAGJ52_13760 [Pseudomonadota bacterium]
MIRFSVILFLVVGLLSPSWISAQVRIDPGGVGDALIEPYWTAAGGNDSLITIRNEGDRATVAKVRWLSSEGEILLSYNLYLNSHQAWTGAVATVNGAAVLINVADACRLRGELGEVFALDDPLQDIDQLSGSIEIIQMASVPRDSVVVNGGFWRACEELIARFNSGPWRQIPNFALEAPDQTMSATVSFIDVAEGVMSSVGATALAGFSNLPQHSMPASQLPDLSSALDSGAEGRAVRSLTCELVDCRIDVWPSPIEAVAAALTVTTISADFDLLEDIVGQFEWMIHRPLERYQTDFSDVDLGVPATISHWNREGKYLLDQQGCGVPLPFTPCSGPVWPLESDLVHNGLDLRFGLEEQFEVLETSLLAHPSLVLPGHSLGILRDFFIEEYSGTSRLRFVGSRITNDGATIHGGPAIAFALQQYSNGTLTDASGLAVLASYRSTVSVRRNLEISNGD